ncbi:lysine transporter LysE [Saccharospirillum sp. MSK14-1]|uniref:LysE family translocator n=1 Tax=Saccharospirillum sp. MSK14-1 TaxID=1897632 RepID=UPI000D368486|nr:LysE family translocator [Saccharospirillum sp. MSK14-1]PTY37075.1 lysine transporter LysE [Saccharospirillum sp. MSK14-1]
MFDYSIAHWLTFFTAATLLNLSPGPDMAFILGQTARYGRKGGVAAMLGIWTGAGGHVLMAALGLTAVLATSATVFTVIKWIGAAYLVWLGIQALLSRGGSYESTVAESGLKPWNLYREGVLVSLLNPKVAVFFLAFLPQFVVPGAGPVSAQLALHGILIVLVAAVIEPPLIWLGAGLVSRIKSQPAIGLWLDRGLGALLVTLGVRLALSER